MIEGKEKGTCMKNIIAVAAVITVMAIVLIAFFSTASGSLIEPRTFTPTGGIINYEDEPEEDAGDARDDGTLLYVYNSGDGGEKIKFFSKSKNDFVPVTIWGPYTESGKEGYKGEPCLPYEVDEGEWWDSEGVPSGGYFKVLNSPNNEGGWFKLIKHSFTVELVGKKEKVREGESFNLTMKKNPRIEGVMKLTITDDDDYSIMNANGTDIYEILVKYEGKMDFVGFAEDQTPKPVGGINFTEDNKLFFDTSKLDMKEGKYKIILEDSATEVEKKEDIKVEKRYLKVECDEEVVKGEDIVIIIKSSFYEKEANVTVEDIPEKEGKKRVKLDEDGKKKVKIPTENVDYGTYKITVEICGYDMKETKYVKIKKSGTSLEVPEDATVGDIVHIEGTSDYGDFAVFLLDDVFKKEVRISDEEFEWDWDTSGELDGYREIEVFIVNESELPPSPIGGRISDAWQRTEGVDASATIFLFLPTFSMTVAKNIAKGDDVVISGSAIGTDHVYVIVINYKGEVVFPPGETAGVINARTTPVEGGEWEENIGELDSGRYTVIALYEGKDEVTDAIKGGKWIAGDESKTLEQRVAILMDAITSAGSDDQFGKADFAVSTPKVSLEIPGTVEIGDVITVKAETNIKTGEKAFISLSQNSSILKKTFALVDNDSVNASINTSGLLPGIYNVAVDISGRASDEKEIMLVEKRVQEGGNETMMQNESLTEPKPEAVEEAIEGEGETNDSHEDVEGKTPVNVWDLLIAVIVAISISFALKRRRC